MSDYFQALEDKRSQQRAKAILVAFIHAMGFYATDEEGQPSLGAGDATHSVRKIDEYRVEFMRRHPRTGKILFRAHFDTSESSYMPHLMYTVEGKANERDTNLLLMALVGAARRD